MAFLPPGPTPALRRLLDLLGVEGVPRRVVLDLPPDGAVSVRVEPADGPPHGHLLNLPPGFGEQSGDLA